jgi:DNA replication and repair protein RecF
MLTSLSLRDFRCFDQLHCELGEAVTLFVGDNAQGKTSILEAVCMLMRLQSPRTSGISEMIRFDGRELGIAGHWRGRKLRVASDGKRWKLAVDDGDCGRRADYLAESGLVVWMGNEDLQLVRGGGDARRRYLDFIAGQLHPPYRPALRAYEKALRTRNFLLKRDASPQWRQIDAYTKVLVEHGGILSRVRGDLVESLQPWAAEAQKQVSGRDEALELRYATGWPEGADLAAAFEASRAEDQRRRQTGVGPHRDDIGLQLNGLAAAPFASEGQQRTLALALKLAQARLLEHLGGRPPLLLLDDIFGELDTLRRNALLAYLPPGSQKLITTTHLDWAAPDFLGEARIHTVAEGKVVRG